MRNFDLQLFAEPVKGSKLVYLFRVYEDRTSMAGAVLAFTTENGRSIDKGADAVATKNGSIRTPSEAEIEITATCLLKKGDTVIPELEEAMLDNKLMEIWEANLEEAGTGDNKFKGAYYQGYLTSFEKNSNAEDSVEISLTFGINGTGATGDVTVTPEQQAVASYVFADSTQVTGA